MKNIMENFKEAICRWTKAKYYTKELDNMVEWSDECGELYNYSEWLDNEGEKEDSFMTLHEQIENASDTALKIKNTSTKILTKYMLITLNNQNIKNELEIKTRKKINEDDINNILEMMEDDFKYEYNIPNQIKIFIKNLKENIEELNL